MTGYGIGPISTISGEPHSRNGAISRSASSSLPVWKTIIPAILWPEPSGACTSAAKTVKSSEQPRDGVAVEAQHLRAGVDRVRDEATDDHLQRVNPVRERRRDAEVAAAAAQRPEEVGVRLGTDVEHLAVGRDELDAEEVVGGEAVLRHQPAEPAAERVAGDPRRRDRAARDGETMLGGGVVELGPEDASLRADGLRAGIDLDPLHLARGRS